MKKFLVIFLVSLNCLAFASNKFKLNSKAGLKHGANHGPFDAIIVPGVPFMDTSMSTIMDTRIKWACHLYQTGYTKNIIFSGAAVYTPFVEGKIFALFAEKYGVPKENLFSEIRAEHSTENLYYSYKMAKRLGLEKIALATDPFQSLILKRFAKNRNLDVSSLPISYNILKTLEFPEVTIDPSSAVPCEDFVALPERENFWERFKGTLGMKVKEGIDD